VTYSATSPTLGVSAGIGTFNASLVSEMNAPWLATLMVGSYSTLLIDTSGSFKTNHVVARHPCPLNDATCHSTYFPGGLEYSVRPWIYDKDIIGNTTGDSFRLQNVQGVQVDYWAMNSGEAPFQKHDCRTLGDNSNSVFLCIKNSTLNENVLIAGIFYIDRLLLI